MNAREKLNLALVGGSVAAAALIGGAFQSWNAFWLILVCGLAASLTSGGIRPLPRRRRW